jgi:hypothetical protein
VQGPIDCHFFIDPAFKYPASNRSLFERSISSKYFIGLIINDKRKIKWTPEEIVFESMKDTLADPRNTLLLKQFIAKLSKLTPQNKVSIEDMDEFSDAEMNDLRA